MEETVKSPQGGYRQIYLDLMQSLSTVDIATNSHNLGLTANDRGQAEVPFMGRIFHVSREGVHPADDGPMAESLASVLAHYLMRGSLWQPAGAFVTLAELAGPLFKAGSYSQNALERPLIKRFQNCVPVLLGAARVAGGRQGGEAGLGAVSLIFELLPKIPIQLVFYDHDYPYPARATLLFDRHATQIIEFEFLAVLITHFVSTLVRIDKGGRS